ncbi:MAG: hypothetical protein HY430_04155 [Candidatus Levybacteria bacterium]|nr:hypothetical protein [Candidatus Levybacteria bacterium]
MLNAKAFANASTVVSLGFYIVCRVASLVAPDFLFSIARSWFHTFSVDTLKGTIPMDLGTFVFGGITLAVLVWVTTYATIVFYNRWEK